MAPLCNIRIIKQFFSLVSTGLKWNIFTVGLIDKAVLMYMNPIKDPRAGFALSSLCEDIKTWLWTICYP